MENSTGNRRNDLDGIVFIWLFGFTPESRMLLKNEGGRRTKNGETPDYQVLEEHRIIPPVIQQLI
jgi:hypothetical protein